MDSTDIGKVIEGMTPDSTKEVAAGIFLSNLFGARRIFHNFRARNESFSLEELRAILEKNAVPLNPENLVTRRLTAWHRKDWGEAWFYFEEMPNTNPARYRLRYDSACYADPYLNGRM